MVLTNKDRHASRCVLGILGRDVLQKSKFTSKPNRESKYVRLPMQRGKQQARTIARVNGAERFFIFAYALDGDNYSATSVGADP